MSQCIICTTPAGDVEITTQSASAPQTIEEIATKDLGGIVDYEIVELASIPTDYTFRAAWRQNGRVIVTDMPLAREIKRDHLRYERAPLLAAEDIAFMQALGNSQPTGAIVARKQALRDVTTDPGIEAATTEAELLAFRPAVFDA